jgi:ketosteroid isomerase-like protein
MTSAEEEFIALEQAWMEAIQRKDLATLDRILGSEYSYTASGQDRWSRQRWIETVAVYDIEDFTIPDIDVRLYGDVAVVLPHFRQTALVNGEPRSGDFLITDVWARRDGAWQVVARSSIMMTEGV